MVKGERAERAERAKRARRMNAMVVEHVDLDLEVEVEERIITGSDRIAMREGRREGRREGKSEGGAGCDGCKGNGTVTCVRTEVERGVKSH